MKSSHASILLARPWLLALAAGLAGGVAGLSLPARATVVLSYESYHSAAWTQTTAVPAFTTSDASWFYSARVVTDGVADATEVSVSTGLGGSITLTPTSPGELNGGTALYPNAAAFQSDWPAGSTHTFEITAGDLAGQFGTITHPGVFPYPGTIPTFSNFSSFAGMNPAAATFQWNSWLGTPGAPSTSFFTIREAGNVVYSTFLSSTTTQLTVPDGILAPGASYTAEVIFSSRIATGLGNWNGNPSEAAGFAGYDYRTTAAFTTLAVPEPEEWAGIAMAFCGALALARFLRQSGLTGG